KGEVLEAIMFLAVTRVARQLLWVWGNILFGGLVGLAVVYKRGEAMERPVGIYFVAVWLFIAYSLHFHPTSSSPHAHLLQLIMAAALIVLIVRLVQLQPLARWISFGVFLFGGLACMKQLAITLAGSKAFPDIAVLLIIGALDILAASYLLRKKLSQVSLEYRE